ncbi:unnamed protein product [Lepeophtheirus salmonis]|uniref:(salmon louse) hypothetical protein n=1 Tax=Lepeophtheirus salmonis TaxID=72036 RepID=A0A7R8CM77_LEPSM|nr:unnamed protein product [Lepeophtheirus salmonis]CAF2835353.1 unnamed protein product [Lepeophtheirus salmonis]
MKVSSSQLTVEPSAIFLSEVLHPYDSGKNTVLPSGSGSDEEIPKYEIVGLSCPSLFWQYIDIILVFIPRNRDQRPQAEDVISKNYSLEEGLLSKGMRSHKIAFDTKFSGPTTSEIKGLLDEDMETEVFWCDDQRLLNRGIATAGEAFTISSLSRNSETGQCEQCSDSSISIEETKWTLTERGSKPNSSRKQKSKIRQRNHQQKKNVKMLDRGEYGIQGIYKQKVLVDNYLDSLSTASTLVLSRLADVFNLIVGGEVSLVDFARGLIDGDREKRTYAVACLDIHKAFNSVGHHSMWPVCQRFEVTLIVKDTSASSILDRLW